MEPAGALPAWSLARTHARRPTLLWSRRCPAWHVGEPPAPRVALTVTVGSAGGASSEVALPTLDDARCLSLALSCSVFTDPLFTEQRSPSY